MVALSGILLGDGASSAFAGTLFSTLFPDGDLRVDPMVAVETSTTFLLLWYWFGTLLNAAMSVVLLVGSFAVFQAKPSGRKLLLIYAAVIFVYTIPDFIVTKMVIWPRQEPLVMANFLGDHGITNLFDSVTVMVMWGEFILMLMWVGSIPWVMMRAKVKAYFDMAALEKAARSSSPPPAAEEDWMI